ncbi:hypothetical protein XINFAN_03982 [Pseudogemmobacter humi]|uniref:Uncharacterized protein n=1 Tax=Pseudogemmobacter humi TaxID=2483812 RepID=A0A3P5XG09_9RHOB|nr:hypothetical protein XINFAN_03982 [Pseudogemmobacter humi]
MIQVSLRGLNHAKVLKSMGPEPSQNASQRMDFIYMQSQKYNPGGSISAKVKALSP